MIVTTVDPEGADAGHGSQSGNIVGGAGDIRKALTEAKSDGNTTCGKGEDIAGHQVRRDADWLVAGGAACARRRTRQAARPIRAGCSIRSPFLQC
ncbi:hypothetical protein V1279_006484 [Bradyrhizobium sp. AZCC 1610]|uniref:hypothetical protein n=1 Tax=Bradyrhizobium sp. AZCC 1610 TaxID=3117020 RepID=UPI002FF10A40